MSSTAATTDSRARAIDPAASFIVEAPAGSGKTELLIQRYLQLLALVDFPEQVLAITFTRKAAAEMRQRVVAMLRAAAEQDDSLPGHRHLTRAIAARALERSQMLGWSLLEHPQRLRITTIDAFNAGLAQHLPLLSGGISGASIVENANPLYRIAARRTLASMAEDSRLGRALRSLLGTADNSREQVEQWLADTLPQRDRWLRHLNLEAADEWPQRIADSVAALRSERLLALRALIDPETEQTVFALVRHATDMTAASPLSEGDPAKRVATGSSDGLEAPQDFALWQAAARLLLTDSRDWRQRFTRRQGLAPDDNTGRNLLERVLAAVQSAPGLREALVALADCPEPRLRDQNETGLVELRAVLVTLLAELRVLFSERSQIDYTELALAAQAALGAVDAPSELLLALDRRLEHVLVDEFQDTSHLQWRLLELLTSGWVEGDGRTLFLVGDPMQSIYRFRDADLSLFLRAKHHGIGNVSLEYLRLESNYRSAPNLVDWVNRTFPAVFPALDQTGTGQPQFRAATARRPARSDQGISIHLLEDNEPAAEVAAVVDIVSRETARDPTQSIGILVRSRGHLAGLRRVLASNGLHAHATEIDSLADTQLGQDLLGLTRALAHAGDRIAWLALLRSPCCGLGWRDLHALCADDRDSPIWDLLQQTERLAALSEEGQRLARWIRDRLGVGFALRGASASFGSWVRDCWYLIDGPAALSTESELAQAERFFHDLDTIASCGDLDDPALLASQFGEPLAGSEVPAETGVEIMTIHRAKGLEFDTVVLMGLGRAAPPTRARLLLASDFFDTQGRQRLLLATNSDGADPLYRFLRQSEREQEAAERARLLYVAATRARERLYLIGNLDPKTQRPRPASLLSLLWPLSSADEPMRAPAADQSREWMDSRIDRLSWSDAIPMPPLLQLEADGDHMNAQVRPEFEWVSPASVQVGTLIHRELQRLAETLARGEHVSGPLLSVSRCRRELSLLGVEPDDLPDATQRVSLALESVWNDPVGRWILEPHPEAWTELRLTVRGANGLEHLQLDRSFIDEDNRRWIIDYKTGRHLGGNLDQFFEAEIERYRPQLERYAEAVAALDSRPLRVGLYFPLMTALRDWEPEAGRGRGSDQREPDISKGR